MRRIWQVMKALARVYQAYRTDPLWLKTLSKEGQKLGGIYVKFLQQLSTTEIVSAKFAAMGERLAIFDDVALERIDVQRVLKEELGPKASDLVIEQTPFAAGSFAQVYHCQFRDDTETKLVAKILRPSVVRYLALDCMLLRVCGHIAQVFVRNDLLSFPDIIREFITTTQREIDYVHERTVATYIKEYYASRTQQVVIPAMFSDYSSKHILLQECVEGVPLTAALEVAQAGGDSFLYVEQLTGSQLERQLQLVGSEFLTSILQAEWIMADPHPGNIYLLQDNRVALIDFGLVAPAPAHRSAFLGMISQYRALYENRADMGTLAVAMMAFYDYELYQALEVVARQGSLTGSLREYISKTAQDSGVSRSELAAKRQITQLFLTELNAGNRFAIKIDSRDAVLQKAMHNFLATARLACGEKYRTTHYWPMVREALRIAEEGAYRTGVRESSPLTAPMSVEYAQELIVDWMSKVAERDQGAFTMLLRQGGLA